MVTPTFRFDPVEMPQEALEIRKEVRAFIKEHQHVMGFSRGDHNREFSRAMGKKGWIGMTWPKQYGGHERTSFERYVVIEEMLVAGAPLSAHYTGDRQSGPNLLRFGTEEQKNFFLPAIAAGELTSAIAPASASIRRPTSAPRRSGPASSWRRRSRGLWHSRGPAPLQG